MKTIGCFFFIALILKKEMWKVSKRLFSTMEMYFMCVIKVDYSERLMRNERSSFLGGISFPSFCFLICNFSFFFLHNLEKESFS